MARLKGELIFYVVWGLHKFKRQRQTSWSSFAFKQGIKWRECEMSELKDFCSKDNIIQKE